MKPSASGQKTSHNMSKAVLSASTMAWITRKGYPGTSGLSLQRAPPAFFDVLASVDQNGAGPGHDEGANDDETHHAEIHSTDRVPGTAAEVQLLDEQLAQLEHADQQRDKDRQRRDRQVVEDLAHRVRKSPGICLRHEGAVGCVHQ